MDPSAVGSDRRLERRIMASMSLGVFLSSVSSSVLNVALPTLVIELRTDFAAIQWVLLIFLLVVTSLMLSVARLGDMLGKKKVYLGGLVLFTLGSLLSGFAPSVGWLIGFRAIQGIGGVMLQALGLAIITESVSPDRRGAAIGLVGGVIAVGLAIGPGIGGVMLALAGWRWLFWINVPLGVLAFVAIRRFVPAGAPASTGHRFDYAGAAVLLIAMSAYALAMIDGQERGFTNPFILGFLGVAVIGFFLFLFVESKVRHPMVDLELFRNVQFGINLVMGLLVFILLGGLFIIPFYLELVKGYSPMQMGLLMVVIPALMALVSMKAGALSDRFGTRGISLLGIVCLGGGFLAAGTLDETVGAVGYLARILPIGVGFGMFQAPNSSAVMGQAPVRHLGVASGLLALSRNLGQTTGLPLFGAVFAALALSEGPGPGLADVSLVSPDLLIKGLRGAFLAAGVGVLAPAALAIAAWGLDRRRRAGQG